MEQDAVRRCARLPNRVARQAEVGATIRHVAERKASERAVARDRVQIARDAMLDVVEPRRRRLADAACVIAVPAAMGEARNDGGAQETLSIDDLVVRARTHRAGEAGDVAPG